MQIFVESAERICHIPSMNNYETPVKSSLMITLDTFPTFYVEK